MIKKTPFWRMTLLNAIVAGAIIALAAAVSSIASYSIDNDSLARLVRGMLFPFGLGIVVLLQLSLFTGNIFLFRHRLTKKIKTSKMLGVWAISFIGNFIGALLIVWAMAFVFNGEFAQYTLHIANMKTALAFDHALIYGILCNILVCLGVVLAAKGTTTSQKVIGAFLPVSFFVIVGFEHSVANMYYIPAGMLLDQSVTLQMLANNLIPVTIGNIIGGVVVATIMYFKEKY